MNIKICFDFHDIFVTAKSAWIAAFTEICSKYKEEILFDYNNKVSKKEICKKYNVKYETVEEKYREYLKPINKNIEFAKKIKRYHSIDLISLSRETRLRKDLEKFSIYNLFDNIYSKLEVVDRKKFLQEYSKDVDYVMYFNHEEPIIKIINKVIYIPIDNNIELKNKELLISVENFMLKCDL